MKNLWIICLLGIIGIGVSSCECDDPTDPNCGNYDPCFFEKQNPTLGFDIYQTYAVANAPSFLTDTIIPGYSAYVEANKQDAISYEWWYGIDTVIQNEPGISINFSYQDSSILVNNPVPVTLVIEYEPNRECYPNHTGRDTITKYIHFRMLWQVAYIGKWEVYIDGDTENPHEIEISVIEATPNNFKMGIKNLYNEGIECFQIEDFGYKGYSDFLIGSFNFIENGCGVRNYSYSTSSMTGKVDTENQMLYLSWNEGYYNSDNTEFLYFPHTLIGHKVD